MQSTLKKFAQVVGVLGTAALVMVGVVFVRSQGANADDTPAPPVISAISTVASTTGALITWTTDKPSTSQVAYGTTTSYGSFSTLDANNVTNHSVLLTGLTPGTAYNLQIISSITATTSATSSNQSFSTLATPDTAAPMITSIFATATTNSVTVTWTTNEPATSQVEYGVNTFYGASTTFNTSLSTAHSATLLGLTSNTLYHFRVLSRDFSGNLASSSDYWIMTGATSTGTTTDSNLTNRVSNLETRVSALEASVQWLLNKLGGDHHGGTTTPPTGGTAVVDQPGQVRAGTNTDFGGHNFGSKEHIRVTLNGTQVATALTNLEGGFSTGSVTVPSTPGSYTYTFTGLTSGKTASVTITVIP